MFTVVVMILLHSSVLQSIYIIVYCIIEHAGMNARDVFMQYDCKIDMHTLHYSSSHQTQDLNRFDLCIQLLVRQQSCKDQSSFNDACSSQCATLISLWSPVLSLHTLAALAKQVYEGILYLIALCRRCAGEVLGNTEILAWNDTGVVNNS